MRNDAGIGAKVAAAFAVTLALSSCLKTEEFPPEPHIEFKSFTLFTGDSASLVIAFTDGDGDVGVNSGSELPFSEANLRLQYFELENGAWSQIELGGEPYIPFFIPYITPTGQNKTLEGEIAVALDPFSFNHSASADSIKYAVTLLDQAAHVSNSVETGLILVP